MTFLKSITLLALIAALDLPTVASQEPEYAFFINQISEDKQWCLTATSTRFNANLGFRLCDLENEPANQMWAFDAIGRLRSKVDDERCMVVGFGELIFGGVRMRLGRCNQNLSRFVFQDERTPSPLQLLDDTSYCVTNRGINANSDDMIHLKACIDRPDYLFQDAHTRLRMRRRWLLLGPLRPLLPDHLRQLSPSRLRWLLPCRLRRLFPSHLR
jgi:hypothetical protein